MNKKMIALAVSGLLGSPLSVFAADGVTLYGRVGIEASPELERSVMK